MATANSSRNITQQLAGWLGYVPGIEGHGGVVGVRTWH